MVMNVFDRDDMLGKQASHYCIRHSAPTLYTHRYWGRKHWKVLEGFGERVKGLGMRLGDLGVRLEGLGVRLGVRLETWE